jgi:hypothetical protein
VPENKVISLEERAKDEQKPFLPLPVLIHSILVELLVVRNGHLPEREVISGAGPIPVRQTRVRHREKRHRSINHFQQGCAQPRYTTFDNISGHIPRTPPVPLRKSG